MAMPIVESAAVTGGAKAHADRYTAAALDDVGCLLGTEEFPCSPAGCQALLDWLAGFGPVKQVGVEPAAHSASLLALHLQEAGIDVVEVGRGALGGPEALAADAPSVARAARSGEGRPLPAGRATLAQAAGALLVARRSAERDHGAAVDALRALVASAPGDLWLELSACPAAALVERAAALRPLPAHPVGYATRVALAELGRRATWLSEQAARLDELLVPLAAAHAAGLLGTFGPGPEGAELMVAGADEEAGA